MSDRDKSIKEFNLICKGFKAEVLQKFNGEWSRIAQRYYDNMVKEYCLENIRKQLKSRNSRVNEF